MSRFLVIGGFEPSGHDTAAEALLEAGLKRGLSVDLLCWRDSVPLSEHPMFRAHRFAAANDYPEFAGLLDEEWIGRALYADLGHLLPIDYDGYISVHPWSSLIAAQVLAESPNRAPLIDYHNEFECFPVIMHDRIDAYFGGGKPRLFEPGIRSRCHSIGVAIPSRFHLESETIDQEDTLVVAAGADGWATKSLLPAVRVLIAKLNPDEVLLLAPTPESQRTWQGTSIAGQIICGLTDISPLLKKSRWYLSKGGGCAVAEGLVAGCEVFVGNSGVFWEDTALDWLSARQIVAQVGLTTKLANVDNLNVEAERNRSKSAANVAWDILTSGKLYRERPPFEDGVLNAILESISQESVDTLPSTSAILRRRVLEWRDQLKSVLPGNSDFPK